MIADPGPLEITFPALWQASETQSQRAQATFYKTRAAEFAALALAALFGAVPNETLNHAGAAAALSMFIVALIIRVSAVGDRNERRWYDARAAAESIKSASWQFAVAGESYRLDDHTATERFLSAQRQVLANLSHLQVPADVATGAVTPELLRLRSSSLDVRHRAYLEQRVEDQRKWYTGKATLNGKRASQWRSTLIAVEAVACILGLLRVLNAFDVDWLGLLATVAAGIAAWKQTKNYTALNEIYSITSQEITMVAASMSMVADEEAWSQSVHDAEAAFSREHTMWLARRQGPPA